MNEQTNDSNENLQSDPLPWEDPFEKGEAARAIMEMMGITERSGEVKIVTLRALELTVESKVKPADYEGARAYQRFDGNGFEVHIPIYDPAQKIDDAVGNVGVLAHVHKVLARQLDGVVITIANERLDRRIVAADEKAAKKGGVKIGQARQQTPKAL